MTDAQILATLDPVRTIEPGCIVAPDDSSIVRHAAPLDATARQQLREQQIARMTYDPEAVRSRERRIRVERGIRSGAVLPMRREGTR